MAFTAVELGHEYLVLTDHSPRLTVAHGLSAERLTRQLDVVDAVNEHLRGTGFTLLKGIEVDILDDGGARPDRRAAVAARPAGRQRPLQAQDGAGRDDAPDDGGDRQPPHERARPLHRSPGDGQPGGAAGQQVRRARRVRGLRRARRRRRDQLPARAPGPAHALLELARDIGCRFSIDSDAHAPGQLDFLVYGCERAEAAGIDPDRIVNTWERDRLLAWANPAGTGRYC